MKGIISIKHLHKSFGKIKAVDDISFDVSEGELFAFLGVNGAGKSTTISILCGHLPADDGEIFVMGKNAFENAAEIKQSIGVVFQNSVLDKALSVYDNLKSRAALYGITHGAFEKRLEELCALLDLKELLKRPMGKLSGGQQRRIDIARALLHAPRILILDEPTTGLDPQTRKMIWNVISELRKDQNMTVFLTTHYMEEAADADHIVILDSGRIVAEGTPPQLKNRYVSDSLTLYSVTEEQVQALGMPYEKIGLGYRITVLSPKVVTDLILAHPTLFMDYELVKGRMDDVFLNVTGKHADGKEASEQ